jgi:hypothetical protein
VRSEFSCGYNKGVSFVFSLSRKQLERLPHESQSIKFLQKNYDFFLKWKFNSFLISRAPSTSTLSSTFMFLSSSY